MQIELVERLFPDGQDHLSNAERLSGEVRAAEASARAALRISREERNEFLEAASLYLLGLALAVRSAAPAISNLKSQISNPEHDRLEAYPASQALVADALAALEKSLQLLQTQQRHTSEGITTAYLAEVALWLGDAATARTRADRAWELAAVQRLEADFIRAARLQGTAALRRLTLRLEHDGAAELDRLDSESQATMDFIHERLHHALTRARACQRVDEELPTLIALAELQHALASRADYQPERVSVRLSPDSSVPSHPGQTNAEPDASAFRLIGVTPKDALAEARRLLDDVWDRAERGPFPLFHADALNILARIERTAAEHAQPDSTAARDALSRAHAAAVSAYRHAWLQGPPFAYAFGLAEAKQHLQALGITPPELPPFDESKYAPMPDVPIIPPAPEKSVPGRRSRKRRRMNDE